MNRKFLKVSILLIVCCFALVLFLVKNRPANVNPQEKAKIEKAVNGFLQYSYSFHKFPEDKVNIKEIDAATIDNIIKSKTEEAGKYIKKETELYHNYCTFVERAFKQQSTVESSGYIYRSFGGYCDNIKYKKITISGNTARVDLKYKAHIINGLLKDDKWDKKEISGGHYGYLGLEKDASGDWYVTSELIKPIPGQGP
jgi:hypothetical protein